MTLIVSIFDIICTGGLRDWRGKFIENGKGNGADLTRNVNRLIRCSMLCTIVKKRLLSLLLCDVLIV